MNYLFQDGGAKPKKAKTTKPKTTKPKTKTKTKTTKSKTPKKGGNFLGAVGDLVAPSGWETFATTAGLFALDRADAALRRGKSEKSSAKKGGMRGGNEYDDEATRILETSNQDIVNKFQQNLSESYKMGKQGDYERWHLDTELKKKIDERQRLLPLVSDTNIKKRLKSSIKRLTQRLSQEVIKIHRDYANTLRNYNRPNTKLTWN